MLRTTASRRFAAALSAALCLAAGHVAAQVYAYRYQYGGNPYHGGYPQGGYGYGGYGGYGGYHASTVMEGYGRGMADIIRSQGEYNLSTSEAMKNVEEARKANIENRVRATEAYFQQRRINEANRESQRYQEREQTADWVRRQKEKPPLRLPPDELNPLSGELNWPAALFDDRYQPQREALDQLFLMRAEQSPPLNPKSASFARQVIGDLSERLKANFSQTDPTDFTLAMRFLDGLKSEVKLPPR